MAEVDDEDYTILHAEFNSVPFDDLVEMIIQELPQEFVDNLIKESKNG